jgi:hypothetical protein
MHCHNTIHGLNNWTEAMFEKFGWMILASVHKRKKSIAGYIDGLTHLHSCIKTKMQEVESMDSKHDLMELSQNVEILLEYSKKTLIHHSLDS